MPAFAFPIFQFYVPIFFKVLYQLEHIIQKSNISLIFLFQFILILEVFVFLHGMKIKWIE
jgi:hypothetical protein